MITLLAVSDGYKHFRESIGEYEKRIQKFATIKRLKPISHTNSEYIKVKETLMIMEYLMKVKGQIILLDERWASLSTSALVETIERAKNESEDITFIIGGSYGVDLELFADIPHKTIRISDFIMPHSLALLVLVEQVYRAHEIIKGSGYHHS
jgi:23S rRNA (pseudouridine1915-N3)-methyltransferase